MRITGFHCVVFGVLSLLWTLSRADSDVSCVVMETCVLPCSFQSGSEVVVHWIQIPRNLQVHSFYHGQDQLGYQNQLYTGRTSLSQDQVSSGNASLQLRRVQVQDQGRYKCYTSTSSSNKETFINLEVNAPVRKVHFYQEGNRIICSSEGIYPEPELTWSTNPPSTILTSVPTVHQNEQMLYNISSSLDLEDRITDVVYSCTVRTRTNTKTADLVQEKSPRGFRWMLVPAVLVVVAVATVFLILKRLKGNNKL